MTRLTFDPERVIVSDAIGVMFILALDVERPSVLSCVRRTTVCRWALGLKGSKLKREAA
jgi:hypothetical protein